MARRHAALSGRVEVVVDAPVEAVWRIVSDVTRTSEWSHECDRVTWLGGATSAAPGVRFRGRNRTGPWTWSRTCEVLVAEAPHALMWRTIPTWRFVDSTDWRITLEPVGTGTRIVQSFDVTRCPGWWEWLVSRLVTAHIDRSSALTEDLRRIGAVAATEAAAHS
jgi:uncharacterized protein YndB with AHSA1/START domain